MMHPLRKRNDRFWCWFSLVLNIVVLVWNLAILGTASVAVSFFHSVVLVVAFGILYYAWREREFTLLPVHAGVVILMLLDVWAVSFNIWQQWWWFDIMLHFFGGLFAALFVLAVTHDWRGVRDVRPWVLVLWGVALTVLIGVLWEFAEVIVAWFEPTVLLYGPDILGDLLADTFGALIASIAFVWNLLLLKK